MRLLGSVLCFSVAGAALLMAGAASADESDPVANHVMALTDATKGLRGGAALPLVAKIEVEQSGKPLGTFTCTLFDKQAPKAVANFVGLARGVRPWKDPKAATWVKRPFYDGLTFHRVLAGFLIMGGDPTGTGAGDPGYVFGDEIVPDLKMDKPGLLAMANHGPDTNGSQFLIVEKEAPWLTGKHTIFGQCEPVALVAQIGALPTGLHDAPRTPVSIKRVTIARGTAVKKEKATKEANTLENPFKH